jgi:hypothetical protein
VTPRGGIDLLLIQERQDPGPYALADVLLLRDKKKKKNLK